MLTSTTRRSLLLTRPTSFSPTYLPKIQKPSPASIRMSTSSSMPPPEGTGKHNFPTDPNAPGEQFEARQTHATGDYRPEPSQGFPLTAARKALVDDIIELYSCNPTVERVKRYTPDCVYDDQFVYANDRWKMAGQWFALPKLFKESKNLGWQVVTNDADLIQFRNEQSWTFLPPVPKTAVINALVSLSLEPGSEEKGFIRVKYHKDQANEKDYSHEGLGFNFKKWQADKVVEHMDAPELRDFEADKGAGKTAPVKYGSGKEEGSAPLKDT